MSNNNNTSNDNKTKVPLLYAIMGVSPSIDARELRKHYHSLSLQFHPDRHHNRDRGVNNNDNSDKSASCKESNRFHDITAAYHILSDPVKRAAYDTRHGVNFNSRVSNVHEQITRHNTNTTTRNIEFMNKKEELEQLEREWYQERAEEVLEHEKCEEETQNTYSNDDSEDEDDDDEEEYMPEENANLVLRRRECPFVLLPINASSPSVTHSEPYSSQSWEAFHGHFHTTRNITDDYKKYSGSSNYQSKKSYEKQPSGHHCLKTVTVTRDAFTSSWGLVFSRNNVLLSCSTHIGVPFPAVVLQINDYNLRATDDVCEVIERLSQQTENRMFNTEHEKLFQYYSNKPNKDSNYCSFTVNTESNLKIYSGDDDHGAAKSTFALSTKHELNELHMLLTYNVEVYELRGDIDALICGNNEINVKSKKTGTECEEMTIADEAVNYKLLEQLVPCNQVVSELPSLLPGHCVLRVNSTNVNSATELRNALVNAAKQMYTNERLSSTHNNSNESTHKSDSRIVTVKATEYENARVQQRLRSFSVKIEAASVNPYLINKR